MTAQAAGTQDQDYETAKSGTIYWTISLYIEPDKVASALGLSGRIGPDQFRRLQRSHLPSLALANAIDPLMNDIADRETQGEVQEFLLAATDEAVKDMHEASSAARKHQDLVFKMPRSVSWTTEGVRFCAHPQGLESNRQVRLRRFWLSHNNGALSYHLSFSHYYGGDKPAGTTGYPPSTYYFLSLLQKLAAPKEYALDATTLQTVAEDSRVFDVLSGKTLGIDPLDNIHVALTPGPTSDPGARFWPFVASTFQADAQVLFRRLGQQLSVVPAHSGEGWLTLLERVPFIEVPGLKMPKSRFMFMLHDKEFFDRLMPLDPDTKETVPRKRMVQQECYEPYQAKIRHLLKPIGGQPPRAVHLGNPGLTAGPDDKDDPEYWTWVAERKDYHDALSDGVFVRANPAFVDAQGEVASNPRWLPISDKTDIADQINDLAAAMRSGDCVQVRELRGEDGTKGEALEVPIVHHVPAFEANRPDCLEYLFLAGFNQNIIDFMNQDTSEVLDSIDPIYPDSEDQSSDRFFVRYANHRAMITYVPRSRSLETGNDYIGACPYAFLIHALALHNEFLARDHEAMTMARIQRIDAILADQDAPDSEAMRTLYDREPLTNDDRFEQAELAINRAKLAKFNEYEQFRHANPFRYDTERDVFEKLEQLRGISRKTEALGLAVASLEDHARDLQRQQQNSADRQQKRRDEAAAQRGQVLNIALGMTGIFGAGQMFYWIGEKTAGTTGAEGEAPTALATPLGQLPASPAVGNVILAATEVMMISALVAFAVLLGMVARNIWSRKEGSD
jgi:hypothetical protein